MIAQQRLHNKGIIHSVAFYPCSAPSFSTDAAGAGAGADEFSHRNLTPLPTHPRIKHVARALVAVLVKKLDTMQYIYVHLYSCCIALGNARDSGIY